MLTHPVIRHLQPRILAARPQRALQHALNGTAVGVGVAQPDPLVADEAGDGAQHAVIALLRNLDHQQVPVGPFALVVVANGQSAQLAHMRQLEPVRLGMFGTIATKQPKPYKR